MNVRELYTAVSLQASFKAGLIITEALQFNVEGIKKWAKPTSICVFNLNGR